ncbi:MAG: ATP-grasp domain-containing protein [Flavobacteriales bacterium]|nr:ATP-grasp domain-containing protein [Flavobacteriales bacterium]
MNLLFSCIGKRGYIAELFRAHLAPGDRIIGTSNTEWTSGFHACDAAFLMPAISDPGYTDAVLDLCQRERIDGLLSFFDTDVHRLSKVVDALKALGVKPFIPSAEAADICFDKVRTHDFLVANGIPTARTFTSLASVHEALSNGEVSFPLYVKPRSGFGSRNTFKAENAHQMEVFFGLEPDMIVQGTLGGTAYDFDILNDLDGRVISVVPWRKSLSRMGETEQAITVEHPGLLALGERLAGLLGHAGPLDADLFVDGDVASVLEVNLRFGGGYPVSHFAGADFPGKIVRMIHGEAVEPSMGDYQRDVVMMKELHVMGGPQDRFFREQLKVQGI